MASCKNTLFSLFSVHNRLSLSCHERIKFSELSEDTFQEILIFYDFARRNHLRCSMIGEI